MFFSSISISSALSLARALKMALRRLIRYLSELSESPSLSMSLSPLPTGSIPSPSSSFSSSLPISCFLCLRVMRTFFSFFSSRSSSSLASAIWARTATTPSSKLPSLVFRYFFSGRCNVGRVSLSASTSVPTDCTTAASKLPSLIFRYLLSIVLSSFTKGLVITPNIDSLFLSWRSCVICCRCLIRATVSL